MAWECAVRAAVCGGDDAAYAWHDVVKKAVYSLNAGAQPGATGVRTPVLRKVVAHSHKARSVVASWVDGLLAGAGGEMLRLVRICLLPKKNGGLRPLGIGEPVANVAKRVALDHLRAAGRVMERFDAAGQWLDHSDAAQSAGRMLGAWHGGGGSLLVRSTCRTPSQQRRQARGCAVGAQGVPVGDAVCACVPAADEWRQGAWDGC